VATIEPNWPALLLFAFAWTIACLAFLTIIGMVPWRSRPDSMSGSGSAALVVGNSALLVSLGCATVVYAAASLRWSSGVVVGGLVLLFAPALFQVWPRGWRDTRLGLSLLFILQACLLLALAASSGLWKLSV